jgi:alanine racemase
MTTSLRPTWCELDLSAVSHNVALLREMVGPAVQVFVCLKGDANGCGDVAVAGQLQKDGVAGIAFGNIDRAIACRQAGIGLPILLYPTCLPEHAPVLQRLDLMPTLSTEQDVALWSAHAASAPLNVFLKLDGGGFRAGALPADAVRVATAIVRSGNLRLAGAYAHPMTSYGPVDVAYTDGQIAACRAALAAIQAAGIAVPVRMISSSAIILSNPEADENAVDPGRLMLGIGEFPARADRQRSWRPVLRGLRSRLVMVKSLAEPGDVPRAPFLKLRPGMRIGLIPYGWSDGYPQTMPPTATALLHGKPVRLLGPTHSELMRVDLTDVPDAAVGDEVTLLGRSGDAELTLEDVAAQWGTSVSHLYPAICRLLPRVYVG